ncbi:ATPase, T2SS/T4P/T4SS family [Curtobacterium sp. MCBD17_040]|uniref:GspE/PulE family protein n=1 Tax=Curtobacterium sp. MCBD17_040 TaxID=2175674 RepID=UPI000DA82F6B|nr:ATPase, T2SS/T4P/T4SS family [Curtobacterium sp. MCBD17_040]WIB65636.1 ATPase, T2SS/T4P/T4SS family [Curtobacterium sp. MCBD17_040]
MTEAAITWLDRVIDRSFQESISDIHLEFVDDDPYRLFIRVRRAGDLLEWPGLQGGAARAVVSRIKSLANVGSGSVTKSEEGRYVHRGGSGGLSVDLTPGQYEAESAKLRRYDLRLVVLPTIRGEKYVLRLPSISRTPRLNEIGFSKENLQSLQHLFGYANGLVLFAGPVGAGKTTSMYSALDYLGGKGRAVYSVEDPVERPLADVDQIEVREGAGNTFSSILRSLRRSDLQVLMIGEIRDEETARSAVEISIAGARVISSLHANDSVAAVEALITLSGAKPQQVLQSLRGVVSQRLVKRVHRPCGGRGCNDCRGTGVAGRAPIHEVLTITPEFSAALMSGMTRYQLQKLARTQGMQTLRQDAERRLAAGETTPRFVTEALGIE